MSRGPTVIDLPDRRRTLDGWTKDGNGGTALEDCSLIVATFERPKEVMTQLDVLAGLPDVPGEVVIVDGSPGETTDRLLRHWTTSRRHGFKLTYVRSPAGLTLQRNVGIDASRGRLLFFLDDDCLPRPGYFESLRRVFVEDPQCRVGAACGTIVNEMDKPLSRRWKLRLKLRLVPRIEPGVYFPTATSVPKQLTKSFSGTRPVDMVPGGAAAYRREALERCRFSLYFDGYAQGEDLEMSMRLRQDWQVRWCGDAHVVHNHAPSGRPAKLAHGRMAVRNRYFIWRRHTPDPDLGTRTRFWADVAFGVIYDLAGAVRHPTQTGRFAYGLGGMRGIIDCLGSPPRFEEPVARPEYNFRLVRLTPSS